MDIKQLLTLFKNGEYEKVLSETSDAKDEDRLFLRAISFALTNNYEDACKVLDENEAILSKNLSKLIDVRMEICMWANKLVDAQKALAHYEEFPYVSQEVEEKFRQFKKDIEKKLETMSKSFYTPEDILKLLDSNDSQEIQLAFSEVKKYDISPFVEAIKNILNSDIDHSTRCLGLILLYEKKYDKPVIYNCHGDKIEVVPSKLKTPFQDKKFHQLLEKKQEAKDIAYAQTFETLLATYYLYVFPKSVDDELDDLYRAFDIVTRRYIGWPENKMRQSPNVERLITEIEGANRSF